jgi:hypothetical protein
LNSHRVTEPLASLNVECSHKKNEKFNLVDCMSSLTS